MTILNLQPLDDRVLILPDTQEDTIKGFLVDDDKRLKKHTGTVVRVGTGVPLHNVKLNIEGNVDADTMNNLKDVINLIKEGRPMKVKEGDWVYYGQFAGTRVPIDGIDYIMLRESDIFMRVDL